MNRLKISRLSSNGEGVASLDGLIVFVEGALPGEEVEVALTQVKRNYATAHLLRVLEPSPHRVKPPCPVFGTCGGCQLQHLDYAEQLVIKRQRVVDALTRIGGLKDVNVDPCMPSTHSYHYRNKIQLPAFPEVGLYAAHSHDIVPIDRCLIHCDLGESVFQEVKKHLPHPSVSHVLIKSAVHTKEVLVVFVTTGAHASWLRQVADALMQNSHVKGVVENINCEGKNKVLGNTFQTVAGRDFIEEVVAGKTFRISPHSFFQVNTNQAESIYKKVIELAAFQDNELLIDPFCGVGTFSIIASSHVREVIGVECVSQAVIDAEQNARLNQAANCRFMEGRAENVLEKLPVADVLFLNPPRKGVEPQVIETILRKKPKKIIYMSCNPETLARDIKMLVPLYSLHEVIPFDMFPQTAHVEAVTKLVLNQ